MLDDERFKRAKLSQIELKVSELDKILERSLPPNDAALEARKRLTEVYMWAEWGLFKKC